MRLPFAFSFAGSLPLAASISVPAIRLIHLGTLLKGSGRLSATKVQILGSYLCNPVGLSLSRDP